MASKENAERKELHRKIWAIADDVRGAVDGWDFKQYILGILFYRFISEHMADYFDHACRIPEYSGRSAKKFCLLMLEICLPLI